MIDEVRAIEHEFGSPAWFRGVQKDTPLLPLLYRCDASLEDGNGYFRFFKQCVPALFNPIGHEDFDLYSLGRHHDLATRLLDWTSSLIVALYFAVAKNKDGDDDQSCPTIWCLNFQKMNLISIKKDSAITSTSDEVTRHLGLSGKQSIPKKAIAVLPRLNNLRIIAQRGHFTFHGTSRDPLEKQFKSCIKKIYIDRSKIAKLRNELILLGIKADVIYPDLDHMIEDLHSQLGFGKSR